jgi:hypothetical protein
MKALSWFVMTGLSVLLGFGIALLHPMLPASGTEGILGKIDVSVLEKSQFCHQYHCQKLQVGIHASSVHTYGIDYDLSWYQIQDEGSSAKLKVYQYDTYPEGPSTPNIAALEFIWEEGLSQAKFRRWSPAWFRLAIGIDYLYPLNQCVKIEAFDFEWQHHQVNGKKFVSFCVYGETAPLLVPDRPRKNWNIQIWSGDGPG